MLPVGTSDSAQRPGVRRYPFMIVPLAPPTIPIPPDGVYIESLVYALEPFTAEQVLADFCKDNGLDSARYACKAIVFAKDLKAGKGWLFARSRGG